MIEQPKELTIEQKYLKTKDLLNSILIGYGIGIYSLTAGIVLSVGFNNETILLLTTIGGITLSLLAYKTKQKIDKGEL